MKIIITICLVIFPKVLVLNAQKLNLQAKDSTFYSLQSALKSPLDVYEINLSHQPFNADTIDLSAFTNLERLILSYNELFFLPKGLSKLSKLKVLDISGNNFKLLPEELAYIPNLEELFLNNDLLLDFDQSFIVINKIKKLKRLHLDSIPHFSLPKHLQLNTSIEYISMRFDGLSSIPYELHKFKHLKTLDIKGNYILYNRIDFVENKEIREVSFANSSQFDFPKSLLTFTYKNNWSNPSIANYSLSNRGGYGIAYCRQDNSLMRNPLNNFNGEGFGIRVNW